MSKQLQIRQKGDEKSGKKKHIKEINAQTKSLLRHLFGEKPLSLIMSLNYLVPNVSILTNFLKWLGVQNLLIDQ